MNTFIVFFGYVAGGLILLNTLATLGQGTSAIHQIYQILGFGFGTSLILLSAIAQNTKRSKDE